MSTLILSLTRNWTTEERYASFLEEWAMCLLEPNMPLILENAIKIDKDLNMHWESSRIRIKTQYKIKRGAKLLAKEVKEPTVQ
jgi:hypothetical protein